MKTLQKYPCISCNQEVTQRQEGLLCEGCNRWQHRTCNTGVTRQQYRNAIRSNCDIVWQCTQCSIPEEPNPEEPNFEESGPDFSSDDDVPDPEEPNIEDSDLDEPNFEESGPDFGSDDDEEQNSDKPDSSDELPNKNGDIKWQCVVRNSKVKCYAQVTESGDSFVVGSQPHLHPADPGAIQKNTMRTQGKEDAIANPYKSGLQIAKDLQRDNQVPQLPATSTLARIFNRHRQNTRPNHPTTLEGFTVDCNHVPAIFKTFQIEVGERIHIVWISDHQRALLKKAKTWYMDGTFKLVREPFKQLYSIHAFITNGTVTKQVPLLFVLMSGRKCCDYRSVFRLLKEKIGGLCVEEVVMDFEKASWKAALLEFPDVRRRGCTFHWTVWKNVQSLGLQPAYQNDPPTHTYIRKLLALPMLPAEHISAVFYHLTEDAVTPQLEELVNYIQDQWITTRFFPPATWSAFFQTTRTNNDCEGWHGALNRRAAKSKLPIYLLVQLLGEEAQMVTVEAQLVSEGTLSRYQRSTNRRIQGRLFAAWEDYMRTTPKKAKRLLSRCSGIYHPC